MPVHPLSRSVPLSAVRRSISSGPPAAFLPHGLAQAAGAGQTGVWPPDGLQMSFRVSGSAFGLPVLLVVLNLMSSFPGFLLFFRSATGTSVTAPQVLLDKSAGRASVGPFFWTGCTGGAAVH